MLVQSQSGNTIPQVFVSWQFGPRRIRRPGSKGLSWSGKRAVKENLHGGGDEVGKSPKAGDDGRELVELAAERRSLSSSSILDGRHTNDLRYSLSISV